jgi:acylphosphatase
VRRAHVLVSGQVQGVGFRYRTRVRARELGLVGWVRNVYGEKLKMEKGKWKRFTGVEAVFEGGEEKVEEMIDWCRQGPPGAIVAKVRFWWEKPEGIKEFEVRR